MPLATESPETFSDTSSATDVTPPRASRARPMPLSERRAMILDAAVPLFMAHGKSVTTRQIADRAGIAEGTVFRAFGDKEAIVDAAVERFLDPAPLRESLRLIDPDDSLESKIRDIVFQLRERYAGIFGLLSALRMHGPPPDAVKRAGGARPHMPDAGERADSTHAIAEILATEAVRLRIDPGIAASWVRLIAFATSIGPAAELHRFTTDELVGLIVHGIAGPSPLHPPSTAHSTSPSTRPSTTHSTSSSTL